jgi:hypothetical protein
MVNGPPTAASTCVLTFHRIVDSSLRDHDVSTRAFENVLSMVAGANATSETDLATPGDTQPSVALTFDDGTEDHRRTAEVLEARGLRGMFFVSTSRLGVTGYLAADDIQALARAGHTIGSHSHTHGSLRGLSVESVREEVVRSKSVLEDITSRPVTHFAPPGGIGHPALAHELIEAGFTCSRGMRWGIYAQPSDRWDIPCIPVTGFTLRRGWLRTGIARQRIPREMAVVWELKRAMPEGPRLAVRRALHRARRPAA